MSAWRMIPAFGAGAGSWVIADLPLRWRLIVDAAEIRKIAIVAMFSDDVLINILVLKGALRRSASLTCSVALRMEPCLDALRPRI